MTGGWDQDQFKYWGMKMGDSIKSTVLSRSDILRSQNQFDNVLLTRMK